MQPPPSGPRSGRTDTTHSRLAGRKARLAWALLALAALTAGLTFGLGLWPGTTTGAGATPASPVSSTAASRPALIEAAFTPAPPTPVPPTPTLTPYAGDPTAARFAPPNLEAASRYYTETGHLLTGDFYNFYRSIQGGDTLFGLPLTEEFTQKLGDGGVYRVQYFERARLEMHPDLPPGWRVQVGAVTPAILGSRNFPRAAANGSDAGLFFPQTGHNLAGGFLTYWQAHGGIRLFGLPLSEEVSEAGMTVQYFERARFEYHPDLLGTPYAIQLSPVGYTALKEAGFNQPMGLLVRFNPPRLAEGHTGTVEVAASPGVTVTGEYEGRTLFFENDRQSGTATALLGTVPFADLGPHQVILHFSPADGAGAGATVTRTLDIVPYAFPSESLQFDPDTAALLDPALTGPERETLDRIFSGRTPEQYWSGAFQMPLNSPVRVTSYFATRRCYNCPDGSKPTTYHGGMDMAAGEGTPVHAPAAGKIVFASKLAVRGNAIIIDHGLGVYSLFAHNSKLIAQTGQAVQKGDVVSLSGNTGLSNGPHLHWELHVSGPPVEPLEWVKRVFP